jgi:hypothetical protein
MQDRPQPGQLKSAARERHAVAGRRHPGRGDLQPDYAQARPHCPRRRAASSTVVTGLAP